MPLLPPLTAPGTLHRHARSLTREVLHSASPTHPALRVPYSSRCSSRWSGSIVSPLARGSFCFPHHKQPHCWQRDYSAWPTEYNGLPETMLDAYVASLGVVETNEHAAPQASAYSTRGNFRPQLSRSRRKAQRQSRPATVLAVLDKVTKDMYVTDLPGKKDLSYNSPYRSAARQWEQQPQHVSSKPVKYKLPEAASLYSILARYVEHFAAPRSPGADFCWTRPDLDLLASKGYTQEDIIEWALCLVAPNSKVAAGIFQPGLNLPPVFLLLLFMRRKNIRASALAVVLKHIEYRSKVEPISWNEFKILMVRLCRHARLIWPESMPWIATLYTTEAARVHNGQAAAASPSPQRLLDVTRFCNMVLLLLSLPTAYNPVLSAKFQEKAQFQVLQYMASCSPAIAVTRIGFQAVARNQLAHPKTQQEREWAELKGPGWPPWKENRTAMDEHKAYEYGASRASKILHRLFEAGYSGGLWEDIAQIYAGWDTDSSPTIQTRTSGPGLRTQYNGLSYLRALLWAGRIRTTRTRREAWACFLSHERTNDPSHTEIYQAMFEKLCYPLAVRAPLRGLQSASEPKEDDQSTDLLPGELLEVLPDRLSPLHHVYISESIPTYMKLLCRMQASRVQPSCRLLAFLLETCPDFGTGLNIIRSAANGPGSPLVQLVAGNHVNDSQIHDMPGYLFAAFIRFLCRFGRYERSHPDQLVLLASDEHQYRFKSSKQYLLEYAYTLLLHYRPRYCPAWIAYIENLVQHKSSPCVGNIARYKIVHEAVRQMEQIDLDIDDETFLLVCTATAYAAQAAQQGPATIEEKRHILSTGSPRLRNMFNGLVTTGLQYQLDPLAQSPSTATPVHIPNVVALHAYVRALGAVRDYEGLYSFSVWLVKHHSEVTARAETRHSGSKMLFKTLVALRVAVDGTEQRRGAPADIAQLIRKEVEERVREWGDWPAREYVDFYVQGQLKSTRPVVGGR